MHKNEAEADPGYGQRRAPLDPVQHLRGEGGALSVLGALTGVPPPATEKTELETARFPLERSGERAAEEYD